MAKAKAKSSSNGCLLWIGLFVLALLVELVVVVTEGIATGLTNLAVWIMYGPVGLPPGVARSAVYPLAWSLLGGLALGIAAAVAVVIVERRRLRFFQSAVAGECPPKPPPH